MPTRTLLAVLAIAGLGAADLTVDATQTRQTIAGFGTCLVSWGKYPSVYDDEMAKIYSQTFGFNILRTSLAAWDYPETLKVEDITADKIDLSAKRNSRLTVFIPFAQKLKAIEPDLKVIGTVWSPAPWLKLNKEITAGKGSKKEKSIHATSYKQGGKGPESRNRVDPKLFPHFCQWVVAQMEQYRDAGVPLYAVSPGNEIMFNQDFESCVWTAEDFATIIVMLAQAKAKAGFADTLIFGPETMTQHNFAHGNPNYLRAVRGNPEAMKALGIWATHGYVDGFAADMSAESSLEFWNLIKDDGKPYWMTEGGTGEHAWPAPLSGVAAGVHNSLVGGNANAFVPWQISGAEANTHCLMTQHTLTKKSHAMRHFSVFIRPGSQRIEVGDAGALRVSAYLHPTTRRLVVVAINPGKEAQDLGLTLAGLSVDRMAQTRTSASEDFAEVEPVTITSGKGSVRIPAEAIVTLAGEGR